MNQNAAFFNDMKCMLNARYPIIYIESFEFERVYRNIKGIAQSESYDLYSWNPVNTFRKLSLDKDGFSIIGESISDPEGVLQEIAKQEKSTEKEIFVLEGFHDFIEDKMVKVWLRKFGEDLKYAKGSKHIILLSPVLNLPKELEKFITVLNLPLPDRDELNKTLNRVTKDANTTVQEGISNKLVEAAMGMTEMEADLAFCLAWAKDKLDKNSPDIVIREKEQIIKKSGILEFFPRKEGMGDIGGLDSLKAWLDKRGMAFTPSARNFHLSEPRGILLLGVPGCGKSLSAKAIASKWNMPLLRLDLGKIFEGVVGSSESNIRTAIKTAEAVAPCIFWIDEIEKGLAGTSNSGNTDSGVTARVFSTLLTWMQEKNKPVFVVATANGIENLPPELLRKGRFDAIFFVDLPTALEREEILKIHLRKRGQEPDQFSLTMLASKTIGFNGAELEEVVNDALFHAFADNPREPVLQMKHLVQAIETTVILATTMSERITFLRKWALQRAIPAGVVNTEEIPNKNIPLAPSEMQVERKRAL